MTLSLNVSEFDLLRELIEKECGIAVGEDKAYLLEARLSKIALDNACENFTLFYQKIKTDRQLKGKVIDAMTTNETLWFRDNKPYECFRRYFLPEFAEALQQKQKSQIRIWSAACSTGQEPYSIAISAQEHARLHTEHTMLKRDMTILASDISSSVLFLARNGRYDALSMSRGMPEDMKSRYFEENGRVFTLRDEVKQMVQFQQVNLMESLDHLGKFDLILLRNVAIYFSKEVKTDLFRRVARCLNPGGYLLVGASESLMGYSNDFLPRQEGDYHFYQLKAGGCA